MTQLRIQHRTKYSYLRPVEFGRHRLVLRHAREVHLVTPHQARACTFEEMRALIPAAARALVQHGVLEQIFPDAHTCTLGGPGDAIVVTGSIYLLGEGLERIEPGRGAGEGRLQDV